MANAARLHLSLSDIARLANVQRPVVSMWRRRPLAGHTFPDPIDSVAGVEHFDAVEVADYLALTGRGNNREAGEDLVAHAKLGQVTDLDEAVAVAGVTALLCLATMSDKSLGDLTAIALRALALRVDPGDTFVRREITALGPELEFLAAHSDALANASYSAPAAFERLLHQHARVVPGHAASALAPTGRSLVARTAAALAADAGMDMPLFVDVTDSSGDLLLTTVELYAAESAPSVATVMLDSPTARLARRRLRVHDVHRLDVDVDEAGDFSIAGHAGERAVHVMQLPPSGSPGMSDVEVIDAVASLIVQMADNSRVVVLGPASALTDRPVSTEIDLIRDAVLRSGRLRVAIRLPKGLLVRSPRRPLALWALGPAHPAMAVRDRWTVVGDVSDRPLDGALIDGLVTDIVAAMTPDDRSAKGGLRSDEAVIDEPDHVRGHRFRFARRVPTTSLLVGRKALVDNAVQPEPTESSNARTADLTLRIDRLVGELGDSRMAGLRVEARQRTPQPGFARESVTTLGQAVAKGDLRVVAGNRLNAEQVTSSQGGRVIIGPAEVLGAAPFGGRRIGLLEFAGGCPSGRLTEPGDVVISTSPRIGAFIDSGGGSVVHSPARILRITQAGQRRFLPATLSADVRRTSPRKTKDWRRWSVRVLPDAADAPLKGTIETIEHEREALAARIVILDDLATALIDGVGGGTVRITRPADSPIETNTPGTSVPPTTAPQSRTPQTATTEGP